MSDPDLEQVALRLEMERPVPAAGFRADLHVRLRALREDGPPANLRLAVVSYLTAGSALLSVAALGLAGLGPLAG